MSPIMIINANIYTRTSKEHDMHYGKINNRTDDEQKQI